MQDESKNGLQELEKRVDEIDKTLLTARIYWKVISVVAGAFGLTLSGAIGYLIFQFGNVDSKAQAAKKTTISAIQTAQANAIESVSHQVESFRLLAVPIGSIVPFAGPVSEYEVDKPEDKLAVRATIEALEKSGWLICDGRPLRQDEFPELYDKIQEAHGGGFDTENNRTGDFNLPDYRGMFIRGVDHGNKNDPDTVIRIPAENGGNSRDRVGSIQPSATALPRTPVILSGGGHTHTHYLRKKGSEDRGHHRGAEGKHWPGSIYSHAWKVPVNGAGEHEHQIKGGDNETRPINAYVNFLIRAR